MEKMGKVAPKKDILMNHIGAFCSLGENKTRRRRRKGGPKDQLGSFLD